MSNVNFSQKDELFLLAISYMQFIITEDDKAAAAISETMEPEQLALGLTLANMALISRIYSTENLSGEELLSELRSQFLERKTT